MMLVGMPSLKVLAKRDVLASNLSSVVQEHHRGPEKSKENFTLFIEPSEECCMMLESRKR
jgi:hypothetical protein